MSDEPKDDFARCIIGGWPETILAASGIKPAAPLSSAPQVTDEAVISALHTYSSSPSRRFFSPEERTDMRRVLEQFAASAPVSPVRDNAACVASTGESETQAPAGSGEWVMVPREPTPNMYGKGGVAQFKADCALTPVREAVGNVYRAMIAAAPSAVEDAVNPFAPVAGAADQARWSRAAEFAERRQEELAEALRGMLRVFSPHPREDTEGWREEHEACEEARRALDGTRPVEDAVKAERDNDLRVQALGAALSRKDWYATEKAYEAIRDAFHRARKP